MNYDRPVRSPAEQATLDRAETRQFWKIAVVFTIAIAAMTGIYVVVADAVRPPSADTGAAQQAEDPAIPVPDGGHKPTSPGDRGGSEQLLLMGGLMIALAGGAAWVVHSSRRARRRLTAAAESAPDDETRGGTESPDAGGISGAAVNLTTGSPEPR